MSLRVRARTHNIYLKSIVFRRHVCESFQTKRPIELRRRCAARPHAACSAPNHTNRPLAMPFSEFFLRVQADAPRCLGRACLCPRGAGRIEQGVEASRASSSTSSSHDGHQYGCSSAIWRRAPSAQARCPPRNPDAHELSNIASVAAENGNTSQHSGRGLFEVICGDSGHISVISESAAGTWLTSTMPEAVEPTTASRILPTCTRRS